MTTPFLAPARIAVAVLLVALSTRGALAQGTTPVPPTDLAYADIERLSELGVLDSVVIGQRPYSRREIGRIVRMARIRLDRADLAAGRGTIDDDAAVQASSILQRLATRFEESEERVYEGPTLALFDGMALGFTSTDAFRRRFPASHSAPTEATIDPLALRRLGVPAERGQTTALELSQRLEATSWLAFHARERLEYRAPRDSTLPKTEGELTLAAMRARFGNVALSVGREQFAWSQSEGDGLFLASDAPALDQISLSGDQPFLLPGFLRGVGPTQTTIIFADLGSSTVRSHSKLLAYKVSVAPASTFELGATFMNHFGGEGARKSNLGNRLVDFLPFIDIFRKHNYADTTASGDVESDKLLGLDGRLRLDHLGGLLFVGEVLIDDFDVHRLSYLFTGYSSSSLGIIIPRIGSPDWSLKLSAKHMGILTYTHYPITNGITTRGRLLGDELGPDAKSFGAELRWIPAPSFRLKLAATSAQYSNAEYVGFYQDPAQTQWMVRKVGSTSNELRDRLIGTLELQSEAGLALVLRAGGERIRNELLRTLDEADPAPALNRMATLGVLAA
ncbi:MAG: capsule assembly Wzi family protein, partial [Gemmatimonadaceae bacterium]